jgi:hypothetical protein
MAAGNILREPLLHFFALGLLLFVLYGLVNDQSGPAPDEIVLDQGRLAGLVAGFEKTWRRDPTDDELQNLIDAWVREEILYREGLAVGFDMNDPVIRRRVAQKMTFVADGMVPESPTEEELAAWLSDNIADYEIPATYTLTQVYIDPQRHPGDLDSFLENTLAELRNGADPALHGDSSLLLSAVATASSRDVARIFGSAFVEGLEDVTIGEWFGPVQSGYGLHFVFVSDYTPARDPVLEEVRSAVERDVLSDKSKQINETFYSSLRDRYTVRIESLESDD